MPQSPPECAGLRRPRPVEPAGAPRRHRRAASRWTFTRAIEPGRPRARRR